MQSTTMPDSLASAFLALCEDTDTPRSLTAYLLFRAEEWDQLVQLDTDPVSYNDADSYYKDVVVSSFFRKTEDLPTSFDRKAAALDNFWKCERSCYSANERLSRFVDRYLVYPTDRRIAAFLQRARENAASILRRPPENVQGRHGPGATFSDRGRRSTVPHKMSSCPTLTSPAWPFLVPWTGTAWATACATGGKAPQFVKGNRFTTVPKDCKKDRGIAVEPSLNLFYQLGVGRAMRARLVEMGIDITKAQDVHRQVACESSIRGHLCTEDLSNASDTICTNLVRLVLPRSWWELCNSLRSPFTFVEGKWIRLEKFSSMGNGFTFELETVIFISVIAAVMQETGVEPLLGENLYVFGDDIIFPTECASDVNAALKFLGMTVNETKSFVSGNFRESCGGDYFSGMDVRPFFLKELPSEPQDFIAIANGIRRLGSKNPQGLFLVNRYRRAWFRILDAIPSAIRRCRGPETLGDLVIHDEVARWSTRWRSSIRYIRVWRPARFRKVPWRHFRPEVILASALYGVQSGDSFREKREPFDSLGVTPRDAVMGYKLGWTPSS